MDNIKIGNFISSERKAKKLTQAKLSEKLFVSEKTISKWENGNGLPDTNTLPKLCEIFNITINELLNGERIANENYSQKAEEKLLDLQKQISKTTKTLLRLEIGFVLLGMFYLLSLIAIVSFIPMAPWLQSILIVVPFIIFIIISLIALRIEQVSGFYECKKCKHKHIPTYLQINIAMHAGFKRYLKCPNCGKKSWHKKVLK